MSEIGIFRQLRNLIGTSITQDGMELNWDGAIRVHECEPSVSPYTSNRVKFISWMPATNPVGQDSPQRIAQAFLLGLLSLLAFSKGATAARSFIG